MVVVWTMCLGCVYVGVCVYIYRKEKLNRNGKKVIFTKEVRGWHVKYILCLLFACCEMTWTVKEFQFYIYLDTWHCFSWYQRFMCIVVWYLHPLLSLRFHQVCSKPVDVPQCHKKIGGPFCSSSKSGKLIDVSVTADDVSVITDNHGIMLYVPWWRGNEFTYLLHVIVIHHLTLRHERNYLLSLFQILWKFEQRLVVWWWTAIGFRVDFCLLGDWLKL